METKVKVIKSNVKVVLTVAIYLSVIFLYMLLNSCSISIKIVDKNKNYKDVTYKKHYHYNPEPSDTIHEYIYTANK